MTTNPEVLRLAREIAELTIPDDTDGPDREYERLIARDAAITAIERTTELAAGYVAIDYDGQGHANGLRDYDHLRQNEKDNSA